MNMFLLTPLAYTPFYLFDLPIDLDFSLEGLPDGNKMCCQLLICMLIEDLTFHCSHRMLHTRLLYAYVHKVHHEHKITISMAA